MIKSPLLLKRITSLIREITASQKPLPLLLAISNLSSVCYSAPAMSWFQPLALWPYNSNCRIQILTHTIKMLSLLSLCLTQFLFQFSFFLPASIILPASFPFYLLLFFSFTLIFPFSYTLYVPFHTPISIPFYLVTPPLRVSQYSKNGTWLTEASDGQDVTKVGGRNSREMQKQLASQLWLHRSRGIT